MKKGDIIIILSVAAVSFVLLFSLFCGKYNGKTVIISKDNNVIYTVSLDEEQEIDLGTNKIIINDKKVWVQSADCKNQICVNHKPISRKNETIACLPNKVLIEIK